MVVPDTDPVLHWQAHGLTDRGRKRRRNEDALLLAPAAGLYAVADGMGGHAAGNVASRIAVNTLVAAAGNAATSHSLPAEPAAPASRLADRLQAAFAAANDAILAHAASDTGCRGMGTTLTAVATLASPAACVIVHVGDSRAYRLRAGELVQLTRDHTWVQQQVDAGMLTPEEARSHARASVLYRVLGIPDAEPADVVITEVQPGDLLLLCSDGLTAMVEDAQVRRLLVAPAPLQQRAEALVAEANRRGGLDNITVVLLQAERAG